MKRGVLLVAAVWLTAAAVRQGVLGQLGLTDAAARELVLDEVANGYELG